MSEQSDFILDSLDDIRAGLLTGGKAREELAQQIELAGELARLLVETYELRIAALVKRSTIAPADPTGAEVQSEGVRRYPNTPAEPPQPAPVYAADILAEIRKIQDETFQDGLTAAQVAHRIGYVADMVERAINDDAKASKWIERYNFMRERGNAALERAQAAESRIHPPRKRRGWTVKRMVKALRNKYPQAIVALSPAGWVWVIKDAQDVTDTLNRADEPGIDNIKQLRAHLVGDESE